MRKKHELAYNAFKRPRAAVQLDEWRVVSVQVGADAGVDTAGFAAGRFNLKAFAANAVHVGRGATQVGDGAGEALDLVAVARHITTNC